MKITKTSKIGSFIRWYRMERLSMSQKEFGEDYGVSHAAVSQWERGETIPPTEILDMVVDMAYQKGYEEGIGCRSESQVFTPKQIDYINDLMGE